MKNEELSWVEVFLHLKNNSVDDLYEKPCITHEQLINDLLLLQEIFPSDASILKSDYLVEGLKELFEGPKFGGKSPNGFRISLVHVIAQMLRSIEPIDGYKRFKKHFKSHRGLLNQLYATCYINKYLTIKGIEQKIDEQDIDIVCEHEGETLFFHVKTIDQYEKSKMVDRCFFLIYSYISERCTTGDEKLGIKLFDGVVPLDIKDDELLKLINEIPCKPGSYKLDFGKGYFATLELDWVTEGKIRGPDSFRNFKNHLEKAEESINETSENKNILIGILGSGTLAKDIKTNNNSSFEQRKLDAEFFIHVSCGHGFFHLERTKVFSKGSTRDFAAKLEVMFDQQCKITN